MIAIWYCVVSFMLIAYITLDGRNFGAGMLHWLVARTPEERSSSGIGRATTFTLAENGYRVLAAVRKQEDVESLLAEAGTRRVVGAVEPCSGLIWASSSVASNALINVLRCKQIPHYEP